MVADRTIWDDWSCDGCATLMNGQPGFTASNGVWTCTECGYVNDVTSNNIKHYGERHCY